MGFEIGGLLAGIAAIGGAGGALLVARRRAVLAHAPSRMPVAQAPAHVLLPRDPLAKLRVLAEAIKRQKQSVYGQLRQRERELVVASGYIRDQLGILVSRAELPFANYHGDQEVQARASFYALLGARCLNRWPLVLEDVSRVVQLEIAQDLYPVTDTRHVLIERDIQIPPPHLPDGYHWAARQARIAHANVYPDRPPAGQFGAMCHRWSIKALEAVTETPWSPTDLPTSEPLPQWLTDTMAAIRSEMGSDYGAGKVAKEAIAASLEGAERVFGEGVTVEQASEVIVAIRHTIALIMAVCDFWDQYRWW